VLLDNAYKVHMKLTIRSVGATDFGPYKCVSKNSLGDTDGSIKLYREYIYTYTSVLSASYCNEADSEKRMLYRCVTNRKVSCAYTEKVTLYYLLVII
jgi:hypothetical protein